MIIQFKFFLLIIMIKLQFKLGNFRFIIIYIAPFVLKQIVCVLEKKEKEMSIFKKIRRKTGENKSILELR